VAARRGKSQARRNNGNGAGLPGWAWLVLGVVLTIGVVLVAPKYFKAGDGDGFIRPRANPDAQPAASATDSDGEDDAVVADETSGSSDARPGAEPAPKSTRYDFYTLLPGEEVAMSDAELAATAREEAARRSSAATAPADAAAADPATSTGSPAQVQANPVADAATVAPTGTMATAATTRSMGNDTPYILQAGAFGASGDAEAVKAKIALLGLGARVESAQIGGKTVYRVRMGPYGTASELAEAKRKLGSGGLPALAIKAK
jgi:cell division protein FtsN